MIEMLNDAQKLAGPAMVIYAALWSDSTTARTGGDWPFCGWRSSGERPTAQSQPSDLQATAELRS